MEIFSFLICDLFFFFFQSPLSKGKKKKKGETKVNLKSQPVCSCTEKVVVWKLMKRAHWRNSKFLIIDVFERSIFDVLCVNSIDSSKQLCRSDSTTINNHLMKERYINELCQVKSNATPFMAFLYLAKTIGSVHYNLTCLPMSSALAVVPSSMDKRLALSWFLARWTSSSVTSWHKRTYFDKDKNIYLKQERKEKGGGERGKTKKDPKQYAMPFKLKRTKFSIK